MATDCTPGYTFTLTYDEGAQQVQACWSGTVPEPDLYAHYAELMHAAETHNNCRFWLLDMRARNWHVWSFGRWFGNEFAANAHQVLGQPLFIAYVLAPNYQAIANSPGVQATQCSCATHGVYPFFFDSEGAARDWLTHQQAHDETGRAQPTTR